MDYQVDENEGEVQLVFGSHADSCVIVNIKKDVDRVVINLRDLMDDSEQEIVL